MSDDDELSVASFSAGLPAPNQRTQSLLNWNSKKVPFEI